MTHGNWKVRTGEAKGSDNAFRESCTRGDVFCYNPSLIKDQKCDLNINNTPSFANFPQAMDIAARHHPMWDRLNDSIKKIMTRNVYQVLGHDLKTPSEMLICYTHDGRYKSTAASTGGTGQAIRIAIEYGIPVFNIKNDEHINALNIYTLDE
jgi:hypothetical protein